MDRCSGGEAVGGGGTVGERKTRRAAMNVSMKIIDKNVLITDEHSASSYGIPVAVVDGQPFGPNDELPVWGDDDPLSWIVEPAYVEVSVQNRKMFETGVISKDEYEFVSRFTDQARYF
jgi:hypothetical protein